MGYMLPYLNVDDLSRDPTRLIGLLLHRTKCLPEEWVPFDHAMLRSGWKQCTLLEKSTEGCIFMYGDHFGQWSTFDATAVHRDDACGAPRALLILESQQNLLKFLRDLTTIILDGAKPSKPSKASATFSATEKATELSAPREVNVYTDWVQFLSNDLKKDRPWLSFGAMFSDLPYSAAPTFDIETLVDIAETQAHEAQDELWLLQTDLEYFHDRSRYHEATWFDKLEKGSHRHNFTAKQKFDNIGFIMTIKKVIHARDWQWLLEECRNVQRELLKSDSKIGPGKHLPKEYERALGSLETMLGRCLDYHRMNLKRFFVRSPAFTNIFKVTGTAKEQLLGTAFTVELRNYTTLFREDPIGWCLYHLTSNFDDDQIMEPSAVLQHLDDFLYNCSRKETERIDQEMQRCISEIIAITRMRKLLDLHRPSFPSSGLELLLETRGAWRVLNNPVVVLSRDIGLGSLLNPLNQFRMPTGRKDEKWLARRDIALSALSKLLGKARDKYGTLWKTDGLPQECIDPQLEWMKQCDSAEHVTHLDNERRLVLDRLRAARERASTRKAAPSQEEIGPFTTQQEVEAKYQVPKPLNYKTKTRPVDAPEPDSLPEDKEDAAEMIPLVLYRIKPASITEKVVRLMFPTANEDVAKENSNVDWMDFVRTMSTFGFQAEHGGGSAFTFRGEILLPDTASLHQKRSITVHRPHPTTEMNPILVQSLGRRCNRRFGWQRANFAIDDDGIERGT